MLKNEQIFRTEKTFASLHSARREQSPRRIAFKFPKGFFTERDSRTTDRIRFSNSKA